MLTTNKRISAKSCKVADDFRNAVNGVISCAMAGNQSVISYRAIADVIGIESHFAINAKSLDFINKVALVIEERAKALLEANSPFIPVYVMGVNNPVVEFHKLDKAKEEYKSSFDFEAFEALQALATDTDNEEETPKKGLTPSEKLERYLKKFLKENPSFDSSCLSAVFASVGLPLEAIAETVNSDTEATDTEASAN